MVIRLFHTPNYVSRDFCSILTYYPRMQATILKTKVMNHLKKMMKHHFLPRKIFDLYYSMHNWKTLRKFQSKIIAANSDESHPTLANITSQIVTAAQCFETIYKEWCNAMRSPARMHRKQWEFVYILEALRKTGCFSTGKRGLGFGCGQEPMPALLAKAGCEIVATDLAFEEAKKEGWVDTQEHAATLDALNPFEICPRKEFKQRTTFRIANMNDIPADLRDFDFLWSSCALEHLGSLEHGLAFMRHAMDCLKPGGIAVHTTEFNLSSDVDTIDTPSLCLFRQQDMLRFEREMQSLGHDVFPFNFSKGAMPIDDYIDLPPFCSSPHLKLQVQQHVTTSIGIIIRKVAS